MARQATKRKARPVAAAPARWAAENVRLRPITELLPNAHNSKKHSAKEIEKLAGIMLEFGWTTAVLRDENGVILAGHKRIMAADLLVKRGHSRFAMAPTMSAEGWSDAQKRAYILADNKVGSEGRLDEGRLAIEFADLAALDFNLDLTGFESGEIAKLIGVQESAPAQIRRVAIDEVSDRFWIIARGPLKSQAKALQALRKVMSQIEGIEVEMGTVADG